MFTTSVFMSALLLLHNMVFCSLLQGPPPPFPKFRQATKKIINAANIWTGDILPSNETAGPREEGSKNIHLECQ
jgi:hypothetical protein